MLTSRVVLTGISIVIAMGGCAVRPLSRRQLGQISTLPALRVRVVVMAVEGVVVALPRPAAFLPAGAAEVAEVAEEIRPAKAPQRAVAAALLEAALEGVEAELLRVLTRAPARARRLPLARINENAACCVDSWSKSAAPFMALPPLWPYDDGSTGLFLAA
jgi:hypothetical protein